MNLVYNNNEIVQNSECYLASPSHDIICKLNSIDESSSEYNKSFMDMKELSFNVYRYINVDGVEIIANGYEELKNSMYLYLTNLGWYKILEIETTNDEIEYKKIVAKSVECELLQYDLLGFKVNTGEVDSAEYLADDNVGVDELAKEYVIFYNPENKQLSLLDLILEKVRGWKIGYVDESLQYKRFNFSIDSTPIYSFMRNELQQQSRCIFVFDNQNYTINAYAIENFEEDTGIYISMRNLANTINISCDDQNIYTCFNVSGGENLKNINRINFGNSYIEDLSYFMCEPYMSSELIAKYQNWLDYREEKRADYISNSENYAYYYSLANEVKNRVPVDDLSNTWKGYTLEELEKYRDFYEATIAAIKAEFGDNESEIQKYPIWHTYIQYIEILGNIQTVIDNYNTSNETTLSNAWETNWDLYGVDELSYKVEAYEEQLAIFVDHKADFIDLNGNYKNWGMLSATARKKYSSETDYNDKLATYIELNDKHNECLLFLNARTDEYNNYVSIYEDFSNDLKIIANDVLIENSIENFTEDELDVLNRLRNYTDYQNENILILNTYDTSQEINSQLDLLNDAKEQLAIASQPQFIFNVDINNLIAIPEFKEWALRLDVGSFIYLEVRRDYIVRLRVTEISGINPFNMQENNLKLVFSNMIKGMQGIDDYNFLLGTSANASKNAISYGSSTSSGSNNLNGIQLTTDILTMIANSNVFKNKFDTLYSNSIVSNEAKFNVTLTDNLDAKIAQIDLATILEATINLGFLKTLIAGHATVADLFSKHFIVDSGEDGSIEFNGTTMQFKDEDENVYIQLGADEQGGHSLIIKDENGNTILDGNGITKNAITDGLIVNDMVKKKNVDYNGISGECLDINSVVTEINKGSTTIKSSQIYFDEDNQTLNTKLAKMVTDIDNNLTTNYLTKQETPEKIVEILGQTDISGVEGEENSIINKLNVTEKTADKINLLISNGDSSSELTLTSNFLKLITENIELSADDILNLLSNNIINLTGKNISIQSDNFKVDKDGNILCKSLIFENGKTESTPGFIRIVLDENNIFSLYRTFQQDPLDLNIPKPIKCIDFGDSDGTWSPYIAQIKTNMIQIPSNTGFDYITKDGYTGTATRAINTNNVHVVNDQTFIIYLVGATSYTTGDRELKTRPNARVTHTYGTTSVDGISQIILGNNTSSGTDGNSKGQITLYGDKTYYARIEPTSGLTGNRTITLPDKSGELVLKDDLTTSLNVVTAINGSNISAQTKNIKITFKYVGNTSDGCYPAGLIRITVNHFSSAGSGSGTYTLERAIVSGSATLQNVGGTTVTFTTSSTTVNETEGTCTVNLSVSLYQRGRVAVEYSNNVTVVIT